jgi:ribosomal protein S18 acetylase RimI-like enzyme
MEIRRAASSDLDLIAPLFDSYRQFYRCPPDPALARAFIAERLGHGDSVIFVALQGNAALGFVQLFPVFTSTAMRPGRLWLLNDLYVAPAARAKGIGRGLMEAARQHAVGTNASGLFLQTARDNAAAQRLYQSLGYRRDDLFLVYELSLP